MPRSLNRTLRRPSVEARASSGHAQAVRAADVGARARTGSPALQGEVVVEWEISPGGDVFKAEVTGNSTGNTELAGCVLQAVKTWTFREPNVSYPSHVRHPFRFQSS